MWRGVSAVRSQPYSKRREYLKEFVGHHWVPDARLLGGIFTSIAQPISLEAFAAKKDWAECHSVEFIPEMCGRRRMVWFLEAQVKAAEAHAGLKQVRANIPSPVATTVAVPMLLPQQKPSSVEPTTSQRKVRAVPVDNLPDLYDLYGEDGLPISRASVQQFELSRVLRAAGKGVWVVAEWNKEFGGYMIVSMA